MLEMILAEQSCLSTGCVSKNGSYTSVKTQNHGAATLFWFKSFSPLSPRILNSHLSRKSVLDEPFGDESFGGILSERQVRTVARCDAVENDAVENDAVENDAVENDAVENDAVENDTVIANLLKLRKAPRLQRNEMTGLSILSKEPPTSYNLFHTHKGANSHD